MKIGDTVSIGQDVRVGAGLGSQGYWFYMPRGSKGFIVQVGLALSRKPCCRLFFGMMDKKKDFYNLDYDDWMPQMCRMVLVEKVIYPLQFKNELDLVDYFNDGKPYKFGKTAKNI